jgi:hypothetical protein
VGSLILSCIGFQYRLQIIVATKGSCSVTIRFRWVDCCCCCTRWFYSALLARLAAPCLDVNLTVGKFQYLLQCSASHQSFWNSVSHSCWSSAGGLSGLGGWQATPFPGACIAGILISDSRAVASHPHMDRCSSWAARVASSTVICCSSVRPCGQCFLIWCSNRLHAQVTWAIINCF